MSDDAGLWVLPGPSWQKGTRSSGCARVTGSICKKYCRPTGSQIQGRDWQSCVIFSQALRVLVFE